MTHLTLGDLTVTALMDQPDFAIPLDMIFPEADPAALAGIDWLGPESLSDGRVKLPVRSWLLRVGGRVILIDTCVGACKDRPGMAPWHQQSGDTYRAALANAGLRPENVDVVMCTHLHGDHVGWNTELKDGRWVPTFPNARYLTGELEYRFWEGEAAKGIDRHGSFNDSVLPVMEAGQMEMVRDGTDLGHGLDLIATPGHTPGHLAVEARHGCGAVFAGDAIHSPIQMAFPEISSAFCSDPDMARVSRRRLLERVADTDTWLVPAHFADPGWMRVARDGDRFRPAGT